MSASRRIRPSGEGERAAISGYQPQYEIAAAIILQHLRNGTLEWIKLADPNAGSLDDFQIASPGRLDAYQIKWSQYSSNVTYNSFITNSTKNKRAPLKQLVEGWQKLRSSNPDRTVIVHWLTNDQPSTNDETGIPVNATKPSPCHFAAFLEQVLAPLKESGKSDFVIPAQWKPALQEWSKTTQLSEQEQINFLCQCEFDLRYNRPIERVAHSVDDRCAINQITKLIGWLFEQVANKKKQIQFSCEEILNALGISELQSGSLKQDFPIDEQTYRPIEVTVSNIEHLLGVTKSGYIALIGSPGSGKSTLLTQVLRYKPIRLARYYAYVPNTRDISALRGESISFLSSVICQFDNMGFKVGHAIQTSERQELLYRFKSQLDLLHEEYKKDSKITIILIDGLDHIHRELKPERSLLADLPRPQDIPEGVLVVLGSQTLSLPDLPDTISQHLSYNSRIVNIDSLSRQSVYDIVTTIKLPFKAEQSDYDLIYQLSAGHPLCLRYLMEKLQEAKDRDAANAILSNSDLWGPDIEQHYEKHWGQIKPNIELIQFLGIICRIPNSIDLKWINTWPEAKLLRSIDDQFGYLFRKESRIKWSIFHNSFRLFLIDKTRQIQPGLAPEISDNQYYTILSKRCDVPIDIPEVSWNKIYYLERSNQHEQLLQSITQNSLREQLYALRPRYSLWEDIYSGLKSTAVQQNPISLMRLILAGRELESRGDELSSSELNIPEILINIGEYEKARLHIRDGYQLMVHESDGLKYAAKLYDVGEITEAEEIFELSEPFEYLSGSTALKMQSDHKGVGILKKWARAAIRFRPLSKILPVIPHVNATWENEHENLKKRDPSQEARKEIYLALGEELIYLERYNTFDELVNYINKSIEKPFNLCFRLLSILWDKYYDRQQHEQANKVLKQIEQCFEGHTLYEWHRLWIATALAKSNGDKTKIKRLIDGIPLLQAEEYYAGNHKPLDDLHWDMIHVAIKVYLGENIDLVQLVPDHIETKYRGSVLFRRAVAAIGRIIGFSWKGELLHDTTLRQTYLPILRLFYQDFDAGRDWLDWHSYRSDSGRLYEYLIEAVQLHGLEPLENLKKAFEVEWTEQDTRRYWSTSTIRIVVLALWRIGIPISWTLNRLEMLESEMLIGSDISGRLDELHKQINAMIDIGENTRAKNLLITAVDSTFGVGYRKDDQLNHWIKWYRKIAKAVHSRAMERYKYIAEAIPGLNDTTEGQSSAAILLIKAIFDISPRRAVMLFFYFWKLSIISYQSGLSSLVKEALSTNNVNMKLLIPIFTKLLIPLSKNVHEDITKTIIDKTFLQNGRKATVDLGNKIVDSVDILAFSDIRAAYHYNVAQALQHCGITEIAIADAPEPPPINDDYLPLDRTVLKLQNGQKMTLNQVVNEINNVKDYIRLFQQEAPYKHFDWASVIKAVFAKLHPSEIVELIKHINDNHKSWELLNAIAEQYLIKGDMAKAREIVMFSIRHINEGNGYFSDIPSRLDTFVLLKKIDHDEAVRQTYSFLLSELIEKDRMYEFHSVTNVLDNVFEVLCDDIPYDELGNELDSYMESLLANEEKSSIGYFNEEVHDDSINRALADIVCENIDHDVSIIAQLDREILIECLQEDIPEIVNAVREKLDKAEPLISILIAIVEASKKKIDSFKILGSRIIELAHSTNIITAQLAQNVASNLNIEIPAVSREYKKELPSIYSLAISENREWDIWYEGELKEGEEIPDTKDPRELVKPNGYILKVVSKNTNIPYINLCMRAVEIVYEKGQDSLLTRRIEKQIRRQLEYTGLKMSYQRPRFRVMYPAILEVVGELVMAGTISQEFSPALKAILYPFDPYFLMKDPIKRPEDMATLSGIEDRTVDIEKWLNREPDNYTPENQSDELCILGETAEIKMLTYKLPSEHRKTVCNIQNKDGLAEDEFGRLKDCCVEEYHNPNLYNRLDNCLVVRNESYKHETGQIMWLAFNPKMAHELKWNLKPNNWFHWINENGETMAKSVWWKDGLIEWFDTYLSRGSEQVEVGEGWRVVVSKKALESIVKKYGPVYRINSVLRVCHQENGTKHEKGYEWQAMV